MWFFIFSFGVQYTDATSSSIWLASQPIITLCLSILMGKEQFTWLKLLGILTVIAGVITQSLWSYGEINAQSKSSGLSYLMGQLLLFIYCNVFTLYVVYVKEARKLGYGNSTVAAYNFLGMPFIWIGFFIQSMFIETKTNTFAMSSFCAWGVALYVIWSAAGYVFFSMATLYLDNSVCTAFGSVAPFVTMIMSTIVVAYTDPPHYGIHPTQTLGLINILCMIPVIFGLSLLIVENSNRRKDTQKDLNEQSPFSSMKGNSDEQSGYGRTQKKNFVTTFS
eukprot:UN23506